MLSLGLIEGVAYWWMHPTPAGQGEPVLVYRPQVRGQGAEVRGQENANGVPRNPTSTFDVGSSMLDVPSSSLPYSKSNIQNPTFSSLTPLPEIVSRAIPSLRCSTGTAARIDRDDDVTLHVAFFEWDLTSSTSVLEAFRHLPEECMGSIGMTLIEKAPVRTFVVRGQGTEDASRSKSLKVESQKSESKTTRRLFSSSSSSDLRPSTTDNSSSSTLTFDHTVFRDPRGVIVHAFKGTWVSGANRLLGEGVRGGADQWRQIRGNAALKRFRPAHARVIQGAVRGIPNPDLAWEAFEQAMLKDLSFAAR